MSLDRVSREQVEAAVLDVIYPRCTCSHGACGRRIPSFTWDGGETPTVDDMEDIARSVADKLFGEEG